MSTETVRLPNIQTHSIYDGKFKDRAPFVRTAGKLTASGDTAAACLKPKKERPDSPEIIRRFRATFRPDAEKRTVFYGKAYDPHLKWAEDMRHGVNTHPSLTAGEMVNPHPKTLFQQRSADIKEKNYASHVRGPLGITHDQSTGLPQNLDPLRFTFGIPTELDAGAGELINPNKTYAQVFDEAAVAHDLYVRSHKNYYVGEHVNRGYSAPEYDSRGRYGKPTPHDITGKMVRNTMKWTYETKTDKATPIVSKRVDEFREKSQPQLGQVHDPIKDTLNVGPDHTFGILYKPDEYGAGDLLHCRVPGDYMRGKDQQRGLVAAMRQHLAKLNYHTFPDLVRAFRFYDKEGKGKIDIDDLREACIKFDLPIDVWLLEQVFDYCDTDRDGQINYLEFANFLNWKEKLPSGFADIPYIAKSTGFSTDKVTGEQTGLVKQGDLKQRTPQSAESTPRRLQKQIDRAIGNHHTSAGMINSVAGPTGMDTRNFRTYGTPSIRSDLAPPRVRRINDHQNYGEESDVYGLTNPSLYSQRGVYEKDLLIPRSISEIQDIYGSIGVLMTGETLEAIYRSVASQHPKGHVSVESFRNALDEVQAAQIAMNDHPMAV
ncbi:EF-hand domain-containing family member B-like [Littorina saxatilis]|uniref:EF-hand domain-containing protein n=1 Tax=Littorina saxatilis TaxID=31220 RepID=A0AAN9BU71_9CAEN